MKEKSRKFRGKEIIIRPFTKKDLKTPEKFRKFINALVEEKAMLTTNKKLTLKEEINFLKGIYKKIKSGMTVYLVAEDREGAAVLGTTSISLMGGGRQGHVGNLGITISKDCRGLGLGKFLMREIIKLARKNLKPRPKIIRLSVFPTNKPAIGLYKKIGFKKAARIPRQFKYKGKFVDEIVMIKDL